MVKQCKEFFKQAQIYQKQGKTGTFLAKKNGHSGGIGSLTSAVVKAVAIRSNLRGMLETL